MIYSKDYLLKRLKELTFKLNRYPTKDEIDKLSITPHSFSYYNYFKTLNDAFKELNLNLKSKCKVCNKEFISNQALAVHLVQKEDSRHINYYKKLRESKINIVNNYKHRCNICKNKFKSKKSLNDHVFGMNDNRHLGLRRKLKAKRFENAKKTCPVCGRKLMRNVGMHLIYTKDIKHRAFYKKQKELVLNLFNRLYSFEDMKKIDDVLLKGYNSRHFTKICIETLGKNKVLKTSKNIFSKKMKNYWNSISLNRRKDIMKRVRKAEWDRLNSEERKNHPWVIAGRKASLESSKRGSKNQRYAFELLRQNFPNFKWHYNYAINDEWHVDIAAPEKSIFLEWDGRYHFIPIHGYKYLNNRINRDKIKNKIVIHDLKGLLIRVKDEGRADKKFVEEKINKISRLLRNNIPKEVLIRI